MEKSSSSLPNKQSSPEIRYDGKTVVITGAGAGLGRAYALMYGKLGANVIVNDISEKDAKSVATEVENGLLSTICLYRLFHSTMILIVGGRAATAVCSAEDGDTIIKAALDKFGSIHVLVANAGILRDKSFLAMTEAEWDLVMNVHLG
jgi:multifunctional beta-oxidation protein